MPDAIAYVATRHGSLVGWGTTPEHAARSAGRLGLTRCEVEPAPFDAWMAVDRSLRLRCWQTERELLEELKRDTLATPPLPLIEPLT